jgi:hypothetical protein
MFAKFSKFRKTVLFFLLFSPFLVKAQYTTSIEIGPTISPAVNYVYLGSLTLPTDNTANSQKLQVDILGGTWGSDSKGVTTFYIANRGGLSVDQVTNGGSALGGSYLKVYQNGNNTDFYLAVNSSAGYYSFAVKSYLFGYATPGQMVAITTQTAIPTGTDITSTVIVNPVLVTDASGNMGIGTISPNGIKLAVKGTVHAQQVNVDLNNWPDYVFKKEYHLPSLSEVKTYIDKNHHLSEIPSAEQIEKDGLNLGEMNKLLVKKVEELTLYLIEKDQGEKQEKDKLRKQGRLLENLATEVQSLKIENKRLSRSVNQISRPQSNKSK